MDKELKKLAGGKSLIFKKKGNTGQEE